MSPENRRRLTWFLSILFAMSLVMGAGPGVLLVNRPERLLGLPIVYVWGLFWYAVQAAVIVLAYRFLWRDADTNADSGADNP